METLDKEFLGKRDAAMKRFMRIKGKKESVWQS